MVAQPGSGGGVVAGGLSTAGSETRFRSGSIDESVPDVAPLEVRRWQPHGTTQKNLLLRKDRDRLAQRRWVHKCVHMN